MNIETKEDLLKILESISTKIEALENSKQEAQKEADTNDVTEEINEIDALLNKKEVNHD